MTAEGSEDAGEEMRITVIATGIEAKGAALAPTSAAGRVSQFQRGPQGGSSLPKSGGSDWLGSSIKEDGLPRGTRNFDSSNRDIPAVVRAKPKDLPRSHAPGENDFIFEEDEFEIPSFIRKQAD